MKDYAENSHSKISSIAVIGSYTPRKCGIATFTADLVESLSAQNCQCQAIAMNDKSEGYNYPEKVHFEIDEQCPSDYHTAADFLNNNQVDIISLQHEFGIFGGPAGDYILLLLEKLHMPIITTLHTILTDPSKKQKKVMNRLIDLSDQFVVMSQTAIDILHSVYDIPREKIDFIPHGIPDMPFVDPNYYKGQFDLMGRKVLLTFGLLSKNKGIEYVIKGLPKVIERFPDLTYIVLGATHPHTLEAEGEEYRTKLENLVKKLNLEDHVVFENHFVAFDELCDYLAAADLYITPYINEQQITSGTLAYAAGTGKAVISTPYWYAKEMLSEGRGKLVPFKNETAIADAISEVFANDKERHQMRKKAYDFNRNATWKEVAGRYIEVFRKVKTENNHNPRPQKTEQSSPEVLNDSWLNLPQFNADHMYSLTDNTGILQHAYYTVARRNHGYCTDDNARALIVALQARNIPQTIKGDLLKLDKLSTLYLGFLVHAFNAETGYFRNFMSYRREWKQEKGSEDAHGRALWGLGLTVSLAEEPARVSLASNLFIRALNTAEGFQSPRAMAFTITGIVAYLEKFSGDSQAQRILSELAGRLFKKFTANSSHDWPWLENKLAYANGKLPHALILAGETLQRDDMKQMGFISLKWLMNTQIEGGHLVPVGNRGWYKKNEKKARFDQQPLEAYALNEACITAFKVSEENHWLAKARICFNWFLGDNDLNLPLYDKRTGGCRDGLQVDSVNQNEGAESTLAWLLSLMAMYQLSEAMERPPKIGQETNYETTGRQN